MNFISREMRVFFGLLTATFVSEDLTVITSGLLFRKNQVSFETAIVACFVGIFVGDMILFFLGFLISRFSFSKKISSWFAKKIPKHKYEEIQTRLQKEGWKLLFLSRFVPGTRFLVYTGAGMLGGQLFVMILVALLAGLIWTPILFFASYHFGESFLHIFEWATGPGIWSIVLAIVFLYMLHKFAFSIILLEGRRRWQIRFAKTKYIEFWPAWVFYLPVPFFILILGLKYKGLNTLTAANPGIFAGGFIGESKKEILAHIPKKHVPDYISFDLEKDNAKDILKRIQKKRWGFPLILKPDVSQKGIGLRKIKSKKELMHRLSKTSGLMILQKYSSGPFEAGVFYYRYPGSPTGKILSITNKVFPEITGNGKDSIADLILKHARFRLQSNVFLNRFQDTKNNVPEKGKKIKLGIAGNHFQGTQFLQANEWITAELTAKIDGISKKVSKSMSGFYFGRYDIRYSDLEKFKLGKELSIIELNGVTSESTDMYDYRLSIIEVYKIMWKQLTLAYKIGYLNTLRGKKRTSIFKLIFEVFSYIKNRPKELVSD